MIEYYTFCQNLDFRPKQCLRKPQGALYGGGIIVNPEFNHNIQGWMVFGKGKIEERLSKEGNKFIVAHSRTHPLDSFSQQVQVEQGKIYSFSGIPFSHLIFFFNVIKKIIFHEFD